MHDSCYKKILQFIRKKKKKNFKLFKLITKSLLLYDGLAMDVSIQNMSVWEWDCEAADLR